MGNIKTDIKVKLRSTKKDKVVHLRIPDAIFRMVEYQAKKNQCTISEVARAIIIEKLLKFKPLNFKIME